MYVSVESVGWSSWASRENPVLTGEVSELDFCEGVELSNCFSSAFWFSGFKPAAPSWTSPATAWPGNFPAVRAEERREVAGLEVVEPEPSEELLGCWAVSGGAAAGSELVLTSSG